MLPRYLRYTQHLALVGAAACSGTTFTDGGTPQDGAADVASINDVGRPADAGLASDGAAPDTATPMDGALADGATGDTSTGDAGPVVDASSQDALVTDATSDDATVFDVPLLDVGPPDAIQDVPTTVDTAMACPSSAPTNGAVCSAPGLSCNYTHGVPLVGPVCTCEASGTWHCLLAGGPLLPPDVLAA